jgi:XTP/dITP diphosphohydrolase
MLKIRFISGNKFKIEEARTILSNSSVEVIPLKIKIEELQTEDTNRLVKDKALKAFKKIGRPLFVEHTGLYLSYMNQLPGGLTQIFWDNLEADKFSELFGKSPDTNAVAKTIIGYVDGKKIHLFEGEVSGQIASIPRGNRDFQWDCVFIPNGYDKTFAELGDLKNEISMRKIALDKFFQFLSARGMA